MTRWTARAGLAGVSAIAAVVSYFHALAVVRLAGAHAPVSYMVPFLADLVILGASAALLEASRGGGGRPPLAMVSLGTGIAVTVAMNVAAGAPRGVYGALVAGWPALAFILALESLVSIVRRDRDKRAAGGCAGEGDADEAPDLNADLLWLAGRHSQRQVARLFDIHPGKVSRRVERAREALAAPASLNGESPDGS